MVEVGFVVRKWSKVLNSPTPNIVECWMRLLNELETAFAYSNEIPICRDREGELGNCFESGYGSLGHTPGLPAGTEVQMRAEESR
jgi:hypothetical protein